VICQNSIIYCLKLADKLMIFRAYSLKICRIWSVDLHWFYYENITSTDRGPAYPAITDSLSISFFYFSRLVKRDEGRYRSFAVQMPRRRYVVSQLCCIVSYIYAILLNRLICVFTYSEYRNHVPIIIMRYQNTY